MQLKKLPALPLALIGLHALIRVVRHFYRLLIPPVLVSLIDRLVMIDTCRSFSIAFRV
jgi:hypothetical protein